MNAEKQWPRPWKKNDAAKAECDAAKAERDAAKAELNQIRAEQCNFRKLILLLIDKKLINELKRAVDDEAYRESCMWSSALSRRRIELERAQLLGF